MYIKVEFSDEQTKVYESRKRETKCINDKTSGSTFEYLKELANQLNKKSQNINEITFLGKQYNEISPPNPTSILSTYLEGKKIRQLKKQEQLIFPFGFNNSQKLATECAFSNQLSVIEGPPGTGKTQTILNIIANAIINNQTVAVVSNNNAATANILEKLQKYGVDFIAAYLGNKENQDKFFAEQKEAYPDMNNWSLSQDQYLQIRSNLNESSKQLNEMLEDQNKLAKLKQSLTDLKTEHKYFQQYYTALDFQTFQFRTFFRFSADKILAILQGYIRNIEANGRVTVQSKVYNLFVHGVYNFHIYKHPPEVVITFLYKMYYETKLREMNKQIDTLSKKLKNFEFEKEMKAYAHNSMVLFKAKLAAKYRNGTTRKIFTKSVLYSAVDSFLSEYPVILSTTHSLRNSAGKKHLFDYMIVDEASQVDLVTGGLALSCAKNAVIVGDVKQLPNVVSSKDKEKAEQIFLNYQIKAAYDYGNHSLLSSILALYKTIPKTLLKEHYRCHPKIIGFCNQKFYNNELIVLTKEQADDMPLILYKTVKGNHEREKFNQRQIDVVFKEIIPEQKLNKGKQTVGIISPYRTQVNELQKEIEDRNLQAEADTVHKFQGREKDAIILSTVANNIKANDFVDQSNLINVAVSRAVHQLIVLTAENSEEWKGTNIGDLVRYIQYNNFEIIESQIYSVFDLLYSSYSEKLLEVMKKSKKVSLYQSEILMNRVIEKVLDSPEFQGLSSVIHQPLSMLIRDPSKLTKEEYKYVKNILTHTDFVIFNKVDKMPVLVVEVDGHAYHTNNIAQQKRDHMKDEILKKYNIPFIRMKTTGSEEEKRLRAKLSEILKLNVSDTDYVVK